MEITVDSSKSYVGTKHTIRRKFTEATYNALNVSTPIVLSSAAKKRKTDGYAPTEQRSFSTYAPSTQPSSVKRKNSEVGTQQ